MTVHWPGWAAFHAAIKSAREAGRPVPTRDEFAARSNHIPDAGKMVELEAHNARLKTALGDLIRVAERVHPHGEHYVIDKADMDKAVAELKASTCAKNAQVQARSGFMQAPIEPEKYSEAGDGRA